MVLKVRFSKLSLNIGPIVFFVNQLLCTHTNLGEKGEAVYTSMEEKAAADRSVREFGFNMIASDKIAMDRSIPDTRLDEYVALRFFMTVVLHIFKCSRNGL